MRIASKGKYFIRGINKETKRAVYPFYDGFDTKKEATRIAEKLNTIDNKYVYTIVKYK